MACADKQWSAGERRGQRGDWRAALQVTRTRRRPLHASVIPSSVALRASNVELGTQRNARNQRDHRYRDTVVAWHGTRHAHTISAKPLPLLSPGAPRSSAKIAREACARRTPERLHWAATSPAAVGDRRVRGRRPEHARTHAHACAHTPRRPARNAVQCAIGAGRSQVRATLENKAAKNSQGQPRTTRSRNVATTEKSRTRTRPARRRMTRPWWRRRMMRPTACAACAPMRIYCTIKRLSTKVPTILLHSHTLHALARSLGLPSIPFSVLFVPAARAHTIVFGLCLREFYLS